MKKTVLASPIRSLDRNSYQSHIFGRFGGWGERTLLFSDNTHIMEHPQIIVDISVVFKYRDFLRTFSWFTIMSSLTTFIVCIFMLVGCYYIVSMEFYTSHFYHLYIIQADAIFWLQLDRSVISKQLEVFFYYLGKCKCQ